MEVGHIKVVKPFNNNIGTKWTVEKIKSSKIEDKKVINSQDDIKMYTEDFEMKKQKMISFLLY